MCHIKAVIDETWKVVFLLWEIYWILFIYGGSGTTPGRQLGLEIIILLLTLLAPTSFSNVGTRHGVNVPFLTLRSVMGNIYPASTPGHISRYYY